MSAPWKDQPANDRGEVLPTSAARQAEAGMGVRYVLAISTLAAFAVMGLIYVLFFMT